ncbi:hypothetical protein GCM10009830_00290 [Glycomyces endophyticus]|uniref:histidine kinase n=1 Tax=Glycomyces endophyticus TaxID=480996 RepID=A0ABN2FTK8_9ACTN
MALLCTLLHRDPVSGLAGFWLLLELAALAGLAATAARHAPVRGAVAAAALAVAALAVQPLRMLTGAAATGTEYAFFLGCWTIAALAAVDVGAARRLAVRRRTRALDDVRRLERLALAGDLHDLVAHDVTGIVLDAQATRAEGDPAQAPEALDRIERAGLEALAAMDRTVAVLRGDGAPGARTYGLADVPDLVDRFASAARTPVRLVLDDGVAARVPREAADAVHRLVAEALTNVRRHAPRTGSVEVALTDAGGALRIRIADTGGRESRTRLPRPRGHGGTGLVTLTARFEALGGDLRAGPAGSGWAVEATLPLAGEAR